jgi:hypothetical protein
VHRLAVNHLLDRSKTSTERMDLTFDRFAADPLRALPPATVPAASRQRISQLLGASGLDLS